MRVRMDVILDPGGPRFQFVALGHDDVVRAVGQPDAEIGVALDSARVDLRARMWLDTREASVLERALDSLRKFAAVVRPRPDGELA